MSGIIALVFLIGWIANIVQLCMIIGNPLTGLIVLKIVGIFIPLLGSILGWVGFF